MLETRLQKVTRGDIVKQMRLCVGFLSRVLATPWFPGIFAATYATFLTLMMYPGILYTDSVARWYFTSELFAGRPIPDNYPIAPYFLMGALRWLTGEIGIYTLTQSFLLSLGVLYLFAALVRPTTVGERALVSALAVAVLLIPVQVVYAVFQAYDSAAATVMLWLSVVLIRLQQGIGRLSANLIAATILLALLVGFRLPAFPVAALALVGIFWLASRRCGRPVLLVGILPAMGLIASPFALGPLLHAYPKHLWIVGPAWRYMVAATEAKDPIHEAFWRQIEADLGRKRPSPPCYDTIYCDRGFLDRISEDQSTRKQAEANMLLMARREPALLARTYLTFAGRVLGVQAPLANAEIGRWHDSEWKKRIEELGFQPNDRREAVVSAYNKWMDVGTGNFLLYPLYLFLGVGALTTLRWGLERQSLAQRGLAIRCALPLFFGALYYIAYIPVSQSHELRYFYPTLLLLQVITASLIMQSKLLIGVASLAIVFLITLWLTAPKPARLLAKYVMPDDISVRAAATVEGLSESPDLKGFIDSAVRKDAISVTLSGWAADLHGTQVTVLALVDGKSVMNVRTSGKRPDVVRALGLPTTSTPDLQFNGDALCSKGDTLRLIFVSDDGRFSLGQSQLCP